MGIATITAARILKGQKAGKSGEEEMLEFDKFPHAAVVKVRDYDEAVLHKQDILV